MSFDVHVRRRFGGRQIEARFRSTAGITVLSGSSGAGKTSILNMVAGLARPDAGFIAVNGSTLFDDDEGIDLAPERRRLGYVFQDGRLFPHRSVRSNLLYGFARAAPEHRWAELDDISSFLGIDHLLKRSPASLSGGEVQRVAIGRALLAGARALLMDEPLSSLDGDRKQEILAVIERIRDELRIPVLYVTHDRTEAERLATSEVRIG